MSTLFFVMYLLQQSPDWFQVWPEPVALSAIRTTSAIHIDGRLDEEAWSDAPWSDRFVDITGRTELDPVFETRTAVMWNDSALFLGARLEEPHVWATLVQRDTVIYYDNDFEFFFDPDEDNHEYGELEINAHNTVWDLLLRRPYRDGGPAVTSWNMEGMQHAVWIDGSLNDPSDTDSGWTIEVCIPWRDIQDLTDAPLPPAPGSTWRINFSRVQWSLTNRSGVYTKNREREDNWVWAPIGIVNMHVPERWGRLVFIDGEQSWGLDTRPHVGSESARRRVMEGYHGQRKFQKANGYWASEAIELDEILTKPLMPGLRVRLTSSGYEIRTSYQDIEGIRRTLGVTQDGRIFREAEGSEH